jgi:hypothetical protein
VNLIGERVETEPFESAKDKSEMDEVFEVVSTKQNPIGDAEMRGNRSITKSMVDYYHYNRQEHAGEDLMSLYKNNQSFIYVICKHSLLNCSLAGFCESSLGHVERLNIESMEWEKLNSITIPRTKFQCVSGLSNNEILIIGGKDQEG